MLLRIILFFIYFILSSCAPLVHSSRQYQTPVQESSCQKSYRVSDPSGESHPVAEFGARDVFFHQLAIEFNMNPYGTGAASVTVGYQFRGYQNHNYLFARDYFPFQVKVKKDGQLRSEFIAYPSFIHNGRPYLFSALHPKGVAPTPSSRYLRYDGPNSKKEFWAEVRRLPLLVEGGNILVAGDCLLVGEKILSDNMKSQQDLFASLTDGTRKGADKARKLIANAKENGWKKRSKAQITAELATAFEVQPSKIFYLKGLPVETTSHVDMYIGVLKQDVVAIPEIPSKVIQQLDYQHERQASEQMNTFLNQQADTLRKLDFKVVRLPMLSPKNLFHSEGGWKGKILSPVNWLINGQTIKVPSFPESMKHVSKEIASEIEAEIKNTLKAEGYEVQFTDAEKLATTRGLLHCITAQYDLREFPSAR